MTCDEAIKLMEGYLDGELDPITSQTIEQHLRECGRCDQAYKTQGSLIRAIGNATPYFKASVEALHAFRNPMELFRAGRCNRLCGDHRFQPGAPCAATRD